MVDDAALKAEALQNSILPRLENIFYFIVDDINKIYQLNVFDESRISKSPNFRKINRSKPITWNYEVCNVGLTGKIKTDHWKNLLKKNYEVSKHTPFDFGIQLSNDCILCYLVVNSNFKLLGKCYQQFDDWIEENILTIFSLLQEADVHYQMYCSDECKPFTSLKKYFVWKKKENILKNEFFSEQIDYPLNEKQFKKIRRFFLYLFPIYQAFIDVAKGTNIKFDDYLNKIQGYYFTEIKNDEKESKQILNDRVNQEIDLKKFAEKKIKVLPSTRWQVFQIDNWKCIACGRSAEDGIILQVDHILPRSKGGLNILSNYQTLCNICNLGQKQQR